MEAMFVLAMRPILRSPYHEAHTMKPLQVATRVPFKFWNSLFLVADLLEFVEAFLSIRFYRSRITVEIVIREVTYRPESFSAEFHWTSFKEVLYLES